MNDWIELGMGGAIDRRRIVAIGNPRSSHIRRLLTAAGPDKVLNLTYGYPREAVLVLDNGYLAVVSLTIEELLQGGGNEP